MWSHGSKVETTERLVYPPGTFPGQKTKREGEKATFWPFPSGPSLVKGDGDGTVNLRSLEVSSELNVIPVPQF